VISPARGREPPAPARGTARIPAHKLNRTLAHVEEHLAGDLRVAALARVAGMSAFHFAHAFRDATGMPPHRYVMEKRIARAKALLRDTALTVDEIAHRIGYSSQSHFTVAFQRAVGIAPSEFRKPPDANANSQIFERRREGGRVALA
jgi:AraC family transcriptional regulator